MPPKGISGVEATMAFTNTCPASISSMQRRCSAGSVVQTLEPSPKVVRLASAMASSRSAAALDHRHRAEDLLVERPASRA